MTSYQVVARNGRWCVVMANDNGMFTVLARYTARFRAEEHAQRLRDQQPESS